VLPSRPRGYAGESYRGLADVLEPIDAFGVVDRGPPPSSRHAPEPRSFSFEPGTSSIVSRPASQGRAADRAANVPAVPISGRRVRERNAPVPRPEQVQDFAFADTVYARSAESLDELVSARSAPSPRSAIFVNHAEPHEITPLAFPLPPSSGGADVLARARVLWARARPGLRRAHADLLHGVSWWRWTRSDLARAGLIGLTVFTIAAALGAAAVDVLGRDASDAQQVRVTRTLDPQPTAGPVVRARAPR